MYTIFVVLLPLNIATIIIAAYNAIKKKHLPGYFIMAGEVILISAMMFYVLRNFNLLPPSFSENYLSDYSILYLAIISMSFGLVSMLTYTKEMHYRIVKEYIEQPKPEPKIYSEEEQEKLSEIFLKLDVYFKDQRPYLNAELHLSDISHQTDIPDHLISKAINFKAEMHFFDFVNSYRIKEATLLLDDEEAMKTFTIEALARQCGFSNKTSFNKAFKKFTGQTPTSYRQKQ
jgi:AraC-like DNA-binding protein